MLGLYPSVFLNAFENPLQGLAKATVTDKEKTTEEYENSKVYLTQAALDKYYPSVSGAWTSLKEAAADGNCFAATNKPKAAIIVHDGKKEDGVTETYVQVQTTGPKMKALVEKLVPGSNPQIFTYQNGGDPNSNAARPGQAAQVAAADSDSQSQSSSTTSSTASEDKADYHGKVIVSYTSVKTAYQVWMAGSTLTAPILKDSW